MGRLVISLAVLVTLTFAMIHLIPGDPVRAALGPRAPQSVVDVRKHQLYLDRPLPQQYAHYVKGVVTGDLGTSIVSNLPVSQVIGDRLPNTAQLVGISFLVIMAVAVPFGVLGAVVTREGRLARSSELVFVSGTSVLAMIPEFVLGVALVYVFAVTLGWLPVAGRSGPESFVLPVAALSIGSIAALARIVRVEMLRVLDEDYMRTARSKRLPARLIYIRHALPNMLTATLTIGGLVLAGLTGGTILVETVFAWPGLGTTVVQSVVQEDYSLAQAVLLLLGFAVLIINLVVDLTLGLLDPRSTIKEA
ncbi:MAG: ABC transporter permease [Pseudonocardiales bacterium]|nr:MAG: ABC transporter permease [Pseudonocardiales bacterium]